MSTAAATEKNRSSASFFVASNCSNDSHSAHFFQKEYTYTCHGRQARSLADRFYTTGNVIKQEQGIDTLEVGTKLMGTILRALLSDRVNVKIWTKAPGADWHLLSLATPGNWSQVENLLDDCDSSFLPTIAGLYVTDQLGGECGLGVCIVNTSQTTITMFELKLSKISR